MGPARKVVAATAVASLLTSVTALVVEISNSAPRRDVNGKIMDCHDGNLMEWPDGGPGAGSAGKRFYLFCMTYGDCKPNGCATPQCGGRLDHNVSLYTSPNLTSGSWTFEGNLLPMGSRPTGVYYRPKVVFNKATGLYVLWANWMPQGDFMASQYLSATSKTPQGPFTVAVHNVTMAHGAPGDFSLFVDDDDTAYVVYTSLKAGHSESIAPLTSDFLRSVPEKNTPFLPQTTGGCFEAPAMFRRGGAYWVLLGPCSCFGATGSVTYVYNASAPLGPYARVGSLGDAEQAQQNYVSEVTTTTGVAYLWTGDRWRSAPDGLKSHDFQFWQVLNFTDAASPPGPSHAGRVVKCSACHPSDPVYWLGDDGELHHLPSCDLPGCPFDWCSLITDVSPAWIANHMVGKDFACGMAPTPSGGSGPVAPLESAATLPSFALDLAL